MTNKYKYFVGNWKMFGDYSSIKIPNQILKFYSKFHRSHQNNKIILCIPNTLIDFFGRKIKSRLINFGAQNCHHEQTFGSFTGSVSPLMLKKAGAKYVILGHSENRSEGETNKIIKKKVASALAEKLNVIFCIGETHKDKKRNKTLSVIKNQIRESIKRENNLKKILFAYEPVWSIGTGKIPKKNDLIKVFKFIKKEIKNSFGKNNKPIVLYGGSVNSKNITFFSSISEIDGFLIGGASQSSKKFIDILKNYYK